MSSEPFYPITSLHKDDLRELYRDRRTGKVPDSVGKTIDALSDADMQHMASKLADAFCNCCYWDALRAIFETYSPKTEPAPREAVPAEALPRLGFEETKEVKK